MKCQAMQDVVVAIRASAAVPRRHQMHSSTAEQRRETARLLRDIWWPCRASIAQALAQQQPH